MRENIRAAIGRRDETETFGFVKPFNCACKHENTPNNVNILIISIADRMRRMTEDALSGTTGNTLQPTCKRNHGSRGIAKTRVLLQPENGADHPCTGYGIL